MKKLFSILLFIMVLICSISFLFSNQINDNSIEFIKVKGGIFKMGDLWGDGDSEREFVHKIKVVG